jgi:acetyl esterase/lipase
MRKHVDHLYRIALAIVVVWLLGVGEAASQARVERNVVYGMYGGLALLMDVYPPDKPNGYGVIVIPGSGWQSELGYGAEPLKERPLGLELVPPIVAAGYTAFVVSHRSAPVFRYPAAVDDVQRAVRYVRHRAKDFGIDPARIGAVGHSSGAHLAAMLGVLDGTGQSDDADPVNREEARVQAVVTIAAPTDLAAFGTSLGAPFADTFVGAVHITPRMGAHPQGTTEWRLFRDASPISWVSPGDAPTLLIHGGQDPVVPVSQAEAMLKALRTAGVPAELLLVPKGGHAWAKDWADFPDALVRWLDRYLRSTPSTVR